MKKFIEKVGLYNFKTEYTKIQENIKAFWLADTPNEKLEYYNKIKFAIAVYKFKKKISVIDFSLPDTRILRSDAMLLQEHLSGISLIDKVINTSLSEVTDDILNYYDLEYITSSYNSYKEGKVNG